jgi:hypothetical protein
VSFLSSGLVACVLCCESTRDKEEEEEKEGNLSVYGCEKQAVVLRCRMWRRKTKQKSVHEKRIVCS